MLKNKFVLLTENLLNSKQNSNLERIKKKEKKKKEKKKRKKKPLWALLINRDFLDCQIVKHK